MQPSSDGNATHRLLPRASKEAEHLGHHWIGPDHFLLALLRQADQSRAAEVLRSCGLTHKQFVAELARLVTAAAAKDKESRDRTSPQLNPAAYRMMGRADGIAAGLGKDQVSPEHVVIAILWDPDTLTGTILDGLDVERDDIVERLAAAGIPVPARPLPRPARWRWGEEMDVPIGHLTALTAELPGLLPPGTPFGFNHDGRERGWIIAGEGVDLPMYVAFALSAWERGRLPCDCCSFVTLDRQAPADRRRCDVCWWVHDPVQSGDPTYRGGANEISLAQARMNFSEFYVCEARFRSRVRSPRPEEFPPWRAAVHC
jgi:Cysteine-rich CPCC/Clp amino terminal domain, pathogenicity island component